jgi:hypothetical protein
MKKPLFRATFLFFLSNFSVFSGQSQKNADSLQSRTCLFDHFTLGAVLEKNGTTHEALLNYDADNQSVLFKQDHQNMILTGLDNVDTVYIGEKKFIPAEDKFYAVATTTEIALLVSYTYKSTPVVAQTDHNGTSRQNSGVVSSNVSETYLNRRFQGQYTIEFLPRFWLKRGHSLYKANNEKQIAKIFAARETAINEFVKTNKTDFTMEKDVAALIQFCNK